MFGWLRKRQPPPSRSIEFDPLVDLDVEAPYIPGAPPRMAMPQQRTAAPAYAPQADAFQEIAQINPEDAEINLAACRQAQQEILGLMRETGVVWSEKEQHNKMLERALEIRNQVVLFKQIAQEVQTSHEDMQRDFANMQNKVISMRQRTSLDQLADFWREHPFLVGFFGADIVHKIKKQLGQH